MSRPMGAESVGTDPLGDETSAPLACVSTEASMGSVGQLVSLNIEVPRGLELSELLPPRSADGSGFDSCGAVSDSLNFASGSVGRWANLVGSLNVVSRVTRTG